MPPHRAESQDNSVDFLDDSDSDMSDLGVEEMAMIKMRARTPPWQKVGNGSEWGGLWGAPRKECIIQISHGADMTPRAEFFFIEILRGGVWKVGVSLGQDMGFNTRQGCILGMTLGAYGYIASAGVARHTEDRRLACSYIRPERRIL